jgi:hypothetical protein
METTAHDIARAAIKTLMSAHTLVGKALLWVLAGYGSYCVFDNNYNIKTVTRTKYVTAPGFVDPDLEAEEV